MAAPIGNQFWKNRSKHGRDALFASSDLLWEAAEEYFEWCDENPWIKVEQLKKPTATYDDEGKPTLHTMCEVPVARPYTLKGLCLYLQAAEGFFREFRAKNTNEDFSSVITRIEEIIYTQKFEGAAVGVFNPTIISRDLGLADKKELSGEVGVKQITGMTIL